MTRGIVHHIDLSVTDTALACAFYEAVLGFMGYVPGHRRDDGGRDFDLAKPDGNFSSIGIRASEGDNAARAHDRYAPGLHHIAWRAESRGEVDALHTLLQTIGANVTDAPADYPEYGNGYYAVFFADPDGLKLEFVYLPS
ncbi:MAG TPA: VOC family protein [Rhizomicrobium sp.]|jgi:catechol 2,3-dioxygenase-like lactoylglutathione lyase family enzyme|nr:VOC family protein [Rhizomicrobium sp.]